MRNLSQERNLLKLASASRLIIPSDYISVFSEFPENPTPNTMIGLNREAPVSWKNVHINSDNVLDADGNVLVDNVTPVSGVTVSKLPESLDFSWIEEGKEYLSGIMIPTTLDATGEQFIIVFMTEEGYPSLTILQMDFITDTATRVHYLEEGSIYDETAIKKTGWYLFDEATQTYSLMSSEQLSIFEKTLLPAYIVDYMIAVSAEEKKEMTEAGRDIAPQTVIDNLISSFINVTSPAGIYLACKNDSGNIEWKLI